MKLLDRYIDALHRGTRPRRGTHFSFGRGGALFNAVLASPLAGFCLLMACVREPLVFIFVPFFFAAAALYLRILVRVRRGDFDRP